ncbi:accessory gland protein Acp29AB-like [Drosophila eugracilis]|uniref:accessory gland protein Acp29AB-like n=1 Tax=Drosophila eugracilis TaxID=29029 RepID=UPI001BD9CAF3|nr:accessory gland protein Acp29AB-like [Drosophila eugracilis]
MLMFGKYFLITFFVGLLHGNTKSQDNSFLCVLQDAPNQCGAFCLSAMFPLFDHNKQHRQKLDTLAGTLNRIEGQIKVLQDTITALNVSIEESLIKKVSERNEGQLGAMLTEMENQLKTQKKTPSGINNNFILPGFKKIGTRFFYIETKNLKDWVSAETYCQKKGGHLASIKDQEEYNAIIGKIDESFWLGINDRVKEGKLVSIASGKPAQFLKWFWNQNKAENRHCVTLSRFGMFSVDCNKKLPFICQGDSEI